MEVRAIAKFVKVQPRKVRQIAREVRGKAAVKSADVLRFHPSKGARVLSKVIRSAVANAQENHGVNPENLRISEIQIGEGPVMKRIQARAMGRANRILKRMSHIMVVVEETDGKTEVKPHGTKAKPRPTFEKPVAKKPAKTKVNEPVAVAEEVVVASDAGEVTEEPKAEATE